MQNPPLLPEFQKYLSSSDLASQKSIPFLAYWASLFLSFANSKASTDTDSLIQLFLEHLSHNVHKKDWQIQQAHDAIELYLYHYLKQNPPEHRPKWLVFSSGPFSNFSDLIDKTRKTIRLKHYSHKTEKTYLHWIKRFHGYIQQVYPKGKPIDQWAASDELIVTGTNYSQYATCPLFGAWHLFLAPFFGTFFLWECPAVSHE